MLCIHFVSAIGTVHESVTLCRGYDAEAKQVPVPVCTLIGAEESAGSKSEGEGKAQLRTAVLDFLSLFLNALIWSSNFWGHLRDTPTPYNWRMYTHTYALKTYSCNLLRYTEAAIKA